jgi:serine protease AprX
MSNPSSKAVWGAVLALALLWPAPGLASSRRSGNTHKAVESSSGESRSVIIRVKAGRKAAVTNKVSRRTSHFHVHRLINAVTARLSPREIREFANDPDVEGVSINADVTALALPADQGPSLTGVDAVVPDLTQILGLGTAYTGSGVTVAIIDSGVASSFDFGLRILAQYRFTNGAPGVPSQPYDDYGHGTHVAGLIGSSGVTSNQKYAGVAPGAKLLSLKVLDRYGSGRTSDVINALEFAVANKARFGIKVVNLSLGHPIYESATTDPLVQAVEATVRSGLVVVVASGNHGFNPVTGKTGYAGVTSPGNAPSAITVGAALTNNTPTRTDDRLADYSSRGPSWYDGIAKPDILAPGHGLVSNDARGSTLDDLAVLVVQEGFKSYLRLSGTSMAAGVVSGVAALMIEANQSGARQRWDVYQNSLRKNLRTAFQPPPVLSGNAIKALLQYSATPLHDDAGAIYGPLEQGAGLVNGIGATALAYNVDTTKGAGQYWLSSETAPFTNFGGTDEPWSQSIFWGTRLLRGTSLVDLHQVAWEDNVVWGTGELNTIVWGTLSQDEDNIVWGTALDEDNIVWGTSLPLSTDLAWAGNAELEDNIVWGTAMVWDDNIVWGDALVGFFNGLNIVWGELSSDEDNIVWGTLDEDNIVWGTFDDEDNVVWGTFNNDGSVGWGISVEKERARRTRNGGAR